MYDDPVKIADVIKGMAPKLGSATFHLLRALRTAWPEIVGQELARYLYPVKLEQKSGSHGLILVLVTESSAWLSELGFYKKKLLTNIQASGISSDISDVKAFVGSHPEGRKKDLTEVLSRASGGRPRAGKKHPFGELEKAYAERLCASIKDEKLRRSAELCLKALIERYGMPEGSGKGP